MAENDGAKRLRSDRGFGVTDAMVFVAATAAGLVAYRVCTEEWAGLAPIPFFRSRMLAPWAIEYLRPITTRAPLWLTPYTIALLLLRLRRPRAGLQRLARQPGFTATLAASSVLAAGMAVIFAVLALWYLPTWPLAYWAAYSWPLFFHCALDLHLPTLMGAAVAGSWAVLRLTGRWRSESGWLDEAGRIVGWCWIALLAADCFLGPWFFLVHHFTDPLRILIR